MTRRTAAAWLLATAGCISDGIVDFGDETTGSDATSTTDDRPSITSGADGASGQVDPSTTTGPPIDVTTGPVDPCDDTVCPDDQICVAGECVGPVCDPPCEPGAACMDGVCVPSCEVPGGYDSCFGVGCPPGSICIVDDPSDPTVSWCAGEGCQDVCDCPAAPEGGVNGCQDLTGSGIQHCFVDCSSGQSCPDGMVCFANVACMWPAEPVADLYGTCLLGGTCPDGQFCVSDMAMSFAWCSEPCTVDMDCLPAPPTGDAPAACMEIGPGADACVLECSAGQTCPDGMTCLPVQGLCAWT